MDKEFAHLTLSVSGALGSRRRYRLEVPKGLPSYDSEALPDGALDRKTKELIALSASIINRCKACVRFHIRTLHKLEATVEEVAEAVGVAVSVGDGPALMYDAAEAIAMWKKMEEK